VGPVVGEKSENGAPIVTVRFPELGEGGHFGVYIRARGMGGLALGLLGGTMLLAQSKGYEASASAASDFTDYVLPDIYSWEPSGVAPASMVLGVPASFGLVVQEVDCVVPFVVP
jgi:hypothetical protein